MNKAKTKKTCFVLYDLNIGNLLFLILASVFFDEVWFVRCNKKIAERFGPLLIRLSINQITEHDYFLGGTFLEGHDHVLSIGKRLANQCKSLVKAFSNLGDSKGYGDLVEQSLTEAWSEEGYINPFIEKFFGSNEDKFRRLYFYGNGTRFPEIWSAPFPSYVRPIDGFPIYSIIRRVVQSMACFSILSATPIISVVRAINKGVRLSISAPAVKKTNRILFLHRYTDLQGRDPHRDMYFINFGIVKSNNCIHIPMATSENFSPEKKSFLENSGGQILHLSELRIQFSHVIKLLTIWHLPILLAALKVVVLCRGGNIKFALSILEYYHLLMISRILLEQIDSDIVFVEGESASISRAIGVEARKQGVRSVAMIHGSGGQMVRNYGRSNSCIDYYIVDGNFVSNLAQISPEIRYFYAAGNIEASIDSIENPEFLPEHINKNRKDFVVIAFFVNIQTNITSMRSVWSKSAYIDAEKIAAYAKSLLEPTFKWIAENENIHLIWRTKPNNPDCKIDNQFVAKLISPIPPDRISVVNNASLGQIARASDLCLASTISSAMTSAILSGAPTVGLDIFGDKIDQKYDPLFSASTGEELVYNAQQLLENGISESAFNKFKDDWNGSAPLEFQHEERIRRLFDFLLESDVPFPDPSRIEF